MRASATHMFIRLLASSGRALIWQAVFSCAVNLLLFTGPLYLLLVYDRVLVARSGVMLISLSLAVAGASLAFGLLDLVRTRLAGVIAAETARAAIRRGAAPAEAAALRAALASPAALALVDLPWSLVFLGGLAVLHPLLGVAGLSALVLLVALQAVRGQRPDMLAAAQRALRMAVFSGLVGLGAWLVMEGALSGGAIFAASLLFGRALAPFDVVMAHGPLLAAAGRTLKAMSARPVPQEKGPAREPATLPAGSTLQVRQMSSGPPGARAPVLQDISFDLPPSRILGLAGDAGAGKTAVIRTLAGDWPVLRGGLAVHAGQAGLSVALRSLSPIGLLAQSPSAEGAGLARFISGGSASQDAEAVMRAARRAGVHDRILALPDGYRTQLMPDGAPLSRAQFAEIALARAVYGDPQLLLLDEPDAALDADGLARLHRLLRQHRAAGGSAIVATKRASTLLCCDDLLVLSGGRAVAQGPRPQVLGRTTGQSRQAVHDKLPG